MKDRSTAREALFIAPSHELTARAPSIDREHAPARRASFTYPPKRRARHVVFERPHAHTRSARSRLLWFTGFYLASVTLFGAFVSAERALLALI